MDAAAAAPVAPGNGRLGRPRAPRVGLGAAGAAAAVAAGEGPSCLYVGPIETASQERLEALYRQVRFRSSSCSPSIRLSTGLLLVTATTARIFKNRCFFLSGKNGCFMCKLELPLLHFD
jgi:hypothetical protein